MNATSTTRANTGPRASAPGATAAATNTAASPCGGGGSGGGQRAAAAAARRGAAGSGRAEAETDDEDDEDDEDAISEDEDDEEEGAAGGARRMPLAEALPNGLVPEPTTLEDAAAKLLGLRALFKVRASHQSTPAGVRALHRNTRGF